MTLGKLEEYLTEFHTGQKKTIENKDELLIETKDKYQSKFKRLNELNELIRVQLQKNKSIEENVRYLSLILFQISELEKLKNDYASFIENEMSNLLNIVMDYSNKLSKLLN